MMRPILIALTLVCIGCQSERLGKLEKQQRELGAKVNSLEPLARLDAQEKCAKQSASVFRDLGYSWRALTHFRNHYNKSVGRCFLLITDQELKPGSSYRSLALMDPFERKQFGEFFSSAPGGFQQLECWFIAPDGQKKDCTSLQQFEMEAEQFLTR